MKKSNIFAILGGLAIVIIIFLVRMPQNQQTENKTQNPQVQTNPNITIDNLTPYSTISSPLTITGSAKAWYFEASFPVKVLNSQNQIIFEGPATAQTDWMTANFVPFGITLTFPPQIPSSAGQIIFMKDNPSGEPQNDDQYILPITF